MSIRFCGRMAPNAALAVVVAVACRPSTSTVSPRQGQADRATQPAAVPLETAPLRGTVYYVRPDGGDFEQCTGLADAAFPGSGEAQPCAWDHQFRALPPAGEPRLAGGVTLLIAAGSYQMGFGAPGTEGCDEGGSFDCLMPPIPSGPDADHPTRILGTGWDGDCADAPELWGSGR